MSQAGTTPEAPELVSGLEDSILTALVQNPYFRSLVRTNSDGDVLHVGAHGMVIRATNKVLEELGVPATPGTMPIEQREKLLALGTDAIAGTAPAEG